LRPKFVSVVVCSRDRHETLRGCLTALQALRYPNFEVVVVDNAPSTNETAEMFAQHFASDPRFRYVVEPAPGLSRARNCGLGAAGTGANFAFDRQFLMGLGGFDEALGAGAPTKGGEDLDIFVRAILSGRPLIYEPSAIVWHIHRVEVGELRTQMYNYGLGLTA